MRTETPDIYTCPRCFEVMDLYLAVDHERLCDLWWRNAPLVEQAEALHLLFVRQADGPPVVA